jgi:hypothetical protein
MRMLPKRVVVPPIAAAVALALAGVSFDSLAEPTAQDRNATKPPSAELAKKCRALAIKAHPTRPAGSKAGSEQAQRDYFRDCITKGGNMPE